MENRFDTDEQLKKLLGAFEATPDSGSFDAILEKMEKKKKRRAFIIFFWTGLIALPVIALPLLFSLYGTPSTPAPVSMHNSSSVQAETGAASDSDVTSNPSTQQMAQPQIAGSLETGTQGKRAQSGNSYSATIITTPVLFGKATHNQERTQQQPKHYASASANPENAHQQEAGAASVQKYGAAKPVTAETGSQEASDEQITYSTPAPEVMYMSPIAVSWAADPDQAEMSAILKQPDPTPALITPETKSGLSFYAGLQASPSFNSFVFSKNPNRDEAYTIPGANFPDLYLASKKDQRQLRFTLSYGIKAGVRIRDTYEVLAGFGYRSFTEKESPYAIPTSTLSTNTHTALAYAIPLSSAGTVTKTFHYTSYSVEVNRLFRSKRILAFKSGLGVYGNHLARSAYPFVTEAPASNPVYSDTKLLSPWLLSFKLKAGLVVNANRRFQLHISPGVCYSPGSVYRKDYVIRQKPWGIDVECLLLFKLFNFPGNKG